MQALSKYYKKNYHDFKRFFQTFCGICQECNPKSNPKGAGVVHVIVFAPNSSISLI
jgi:hypothetical protein